jgi:hypothetical protein
MKPVKKVEGQHALKLDAKQILTAMFSQQGVREMCRYRSGQLSFSLNVIAITANKKAVLAKYLHYLKKILQFKYVP